MHPIQPPSKQELLENQDPGRPPRWRGYLVVAVLAAVTAWNLVAIHRRYGEDTPGPKVATASLVPEAPSPAAPTANAASAAANGAAANAGAAVPRVEGAALAPAADRAVAYKVVAGKLTRGSTVAAALTRAGLTSPQIHDIVSALKGTFDFRYARPGQAFRVKTTPDGQVAFFDYEASPLTSYCVKRDGDHLVGYARQVKTETRTVAVHGVLKGSLYESMEAAGESPALAVLFGDVMAWDVDFYRDPRPGDTFDIVVEKVFSKGRFLHYGDILAAEYKGAVGDYRLFRYERPNGDVSYYDSKGHSAQKILLKAPLKVIRITSRYGMRHHPILGYNKMHRGVDYGAPIGTPVMATGAGTVSWARWAGACGNMVRINNANGYQTLFCHLSRILVHQGQHVHQKQIIGRVGETGRATGPHVHYAVKRYGHFKNPLKLRLPSRRPLDKKLMADFQAHVQPLLARLEHASGTRVASAGSTTQAP